MTETVKSLVEAAKKFQPEIVKLAMKPDVTWPQALDLASMAVQDALPPKFIMEGLPCGYVTGSFGHGGAGKSSIELMRAVCIAAGIAFCGLEVEMQRRVAYVSCEDRADIIHWRLKRICAHLGVDLASLDGRLQILDLVGHESILFAPDPRTGNALTAAYGILTERIREYCTEVLFIDGIADTYGGQELSRADIKRFINNLLALMPPDGAIVLIGHVNKVSAINGSTTEGYSGPTAWHNSMRARWYLYPETDRSEDGERAARTGRLLLELQKANYGEVGTQIEFQWDDSANLFVGKVSSTTSGFDRKHRDRTEQHGILLALRACAQSTPAIIVPAATTGQRTAYQTLVQRPEFPETLRAGKAGRTRFWRQIEVLRQIHAIEEGSYRRANRHLTANLMLTDEGVRQCVTY